MSTTFSLARSLPIFQAHDGFCGVLFAADSEERIVITLWTGRTAAQALDRSPVYRETVAAIEAAGFLRPPQHVELRDVTVGWLDATARALGRSREGV